MKFDVAIMNPPYNGTLHLRILEKVIPHCEKVVNVSPANQFFAAKRLLKEFPMIKKSAVLKNNIADIQLIPAKDASNIFDVAFAGPLMILTYDVHCADPLNYMDYNVVPHKLRSVFDKTIRACNDGVYPNLMDEILKNTTKEYILPCPEVHGHQGSEYILPCPEVHGNQGSSDWSEITSKIYDKALNAKQRWNWHLSFDTEEERRNCYDSWHTRFHQFIHSLIKADNFNYYGQLPFMGDYSQPWTDERFYEYFKLTKEEIDIIETTMKDYV